MNISENIKKIVLPEGEESRMIEAAQIIYREGFAKLVFLGKENKIREVAKKYNVNFPEEIEIIEPENSTNLETYADIYYNLRKNKGISQDEARELLKNPLY